MPLCQHPPFSGLFPAWALPGGPAFFSVALFVAAAALRTRPGVQVLGVPMFGVPVFGVPLFVMLMELIGHMAFRLHEVLLEFLLGVTAPAGGVPQFPG